MSAPDSDKEMLENLDMLLDYEVVEKSDDWDLVEDFEDTDIEKEDPYAEEKPE